MVNRGPWYIGDLFGVCYVCLVLFGGMEMAAVYRCFAVNRVVIYQG